MYIMNFPEYIKSLALAEPTKVVHLNNIGKITPEVLELPLKEAVKYIQKNFSENQQFQLYKTLSKFYLFKNRMDDRDELMEVTKVLKEKMTKKQQEKTCKVKTNVEEGSIKNREQLLEALNTLYTEQQYKKYIINYLLLYFNVRNQDVDVELITKKSDVKDGNYLLIRKKQIVYIRNHYKTMYKYGQKTYTITDKKFVSAVNNFPETKLLHTNNIAREVRNNTIDKLSESQLTKITMLEMKAPELQAISDSRGTDVKTLLTSYSNC